MIEYEACWMITLCRPGLPVLYWYRDDRTGLIGWTTIAMCGERFKTKKQAVSKVSRTVGFNDMEISEHVFGTSSPD